MYSVEADKSKRLVVISFHRGEDGRVKRAFKEGLRTGTWSAESGGVIRASPEEMRANPRSAPARLRWAER